DTPYRVTVGYTNGFTQELQASVRHVKIVDTSFFRPDATLGDATTTLSGTITPSAGGTTLASTGTWTYATIDNDAYSLPWQQPLIKASRYDRVYVSRFETVDKMAVITSFATG